MAQPRKAYPTIDTPLEYLAWVVSCSPFWLHLARIELKNRFRRTWLGILWALVQPFGLTLIFALVLQFIFDQSFAELSVYVLLGLVMWEWFTHAILLSSLSILSGEAFIRQQRLPLVIYPLRNFIALTVTFLIGLTGFVIWALAVQPHVVSLYWLLALPNIALLALVILPFSIWSAIVGLMFRDFPQAAQLGLQALWYVSPVFFPKTLFQNPGLDIWNHYNPIANMLALLRQPLLYAQVPTLANYGIVIAFGIISYGLAIFALRRIESRAVYYF